MIFEPVSQFNETIVIPTGGIGTTLIFNTFIIFFLFSFFLCCLKRLTIFNLEKKRKLYQEYIEYKKEKLDVHYEDEESLPLFSYLITKIYNFLYVFRSFLPYYWSMDIEYLYKEYGRDAAVYLLFQRHIIIALIFCTILGSVVLFPLHTFGTNIKYPVEFNITSYSLIERTSVSMVLDVPWKLYIHVFLSFIFVITFMISIYYFYGSEIVQNINFSNEKEDYKHEIYSYSVQIEGISKELNNYEFDNLVEKIFPDKVMYTTLLYDVSHRLKIEEKIKKAEANLERNLYKYNKSGKRPTSIMVGKDLIEYYDQKLKYLRKEAAKWDSRYKRVVSGEESNSNLIQSTGKGFIIFKTIEDARESTRYKGYQIKLANDPDDIEWKNMCTHKSSDTNREIIAHGIITIIFIFFTTPLAVVSSIESVTTLPYVYSFIDNVRKLTGFVGDFLFHYLPTLLLLVIGILTIPIVNKVTKIAKYKTITKYERMIIFRLYLYYILSIFFVPTLYLMSIDGVIKHFRDPSTLILTLQNMFIPGQGAFFINFIIHCALIKNFIDLCRLDEVFFYFISWFKSVTPKEKLEAAEAPYFAFSYEYSFLLTILCIVLNFSLFSPFIMLFGLAYFIIKHFFDRYNIYLIHKTKFKSFKKSTNFSSHQKTIRLIIKLYWTNLIIFISFMMLFFIIKIPSHYIYLSHGFLELIFLCILFVSFILIFIKRELFQIFYKSKERVSLLNKLKEEDFKKAYHPPFDFCKEKTSNFFEGIVESDTFIE